MPKTVAKATRKGRGLCLAVAAAALWSGGCSGGQNPSQAAAGAESTPPVVGAPQPGQPAVLRARLDETLKDMNGRDVRLADFKGKPIILNFWATWCGPCKAEIPDLLAFAHAHKDAVTVLGISIDDSPEDLKPFVAEHQMDYPVLVGLGHDELLDAFDAAFAVPISWVIRPDGTVQAKGIGPQTREWFEQQVKGLL